MHVPRSFIMSLICDVGLSIIDLEHTEKPNCTKKLCSTDKLSQMKRFCQFKLRCTRITEHNLFTKRNRKLESSKTVCGHSASPFALLRINFCLVCVSLPSFSWVDNISVCFLKEDCQCTVFLKKSDFHKAG